MDSKRDSLRPGYKITATAELLFLCLFCVLVISIPAMAQPEELQRNSFQISAQQADTALTTYAHVTGRRMLFRQDLVSAYQANAVVGNYTADKALEILLENSGLVASMNDKGNVIIKIKKPGEPIMKTKKLGFFAGLLTLLGGAVSGQISMAEDGVGDSGVSAPSLEEIIVTARLREESLQEAPVVVTAFNREILEANAIASIEDLSMLVPTLNVAEYGSALGPFISSRGIASTGSVINSSTDQSVSLNIDGVPFSNGQAYRFAQLDIDQVEFLKGPQALFYGKNSPAGIIALRSANPTEEFFAEFRVSQELESKGYYGHAIFSGPLSDSVGGRLALSYRDTGDGLFENAMPGAQNDSGVQYDEILARGTLTWAPKDTVDLTVKLAYADREGKNPFATQLQVCDDTPLLNFAVYDDCELNNTFVKADLVQGGMNPETSQTGLWRSEPYHRYETTLASVDLNWAFSENWSLNSITSIYGQDMLTSANFSVGRASGSGIEIRDETWTQELRVAGQFEKWDVMAGIYLDNREWEETTEFYSDLFGGLPNYFAPVNFSWEGETLSAFAQVGYNFNEKWSISLGSRYTEEEKEFDGKWAGNAAFGFKADVAGQSMTVQEPQIEYDDLSSEVTLSYTPTDNITLFASYKEGFKSGGYVFSFTDAGGPTNSLFLPSTPADNAYDEETVAGFEAGIKTTWLDNRLKLNAAVYNYEYEDVQAANLKESTDIVELVIENAAEAENKGVEIEATYLASQELTFFGALEYLDAQWGEYITNCIEWHLYVDTAGCNIDANGDGIPESENRAGIDLMFSPEWSASLGFSYVYSLNDRLGVLFNTFAVWKDDFTGGGVADPRYDIDSHWVVNANAGLFALDDSWSLDLIVKNVFDEVFPSTNGVVGFGSQEPLHPVVSVRGQPRQYVLQFTFRL